MKFRELEGYDDNLLIGIEIEGKEARVLQHGWVNGTDPAFLSPWRHDIQDIFDKAKPSLQSLDWVAEPIRFRGDADTVAMFGLAAQTVEKKRRAESPLPVPDPDSESGALLLVAEKVRANVFAELGALACVGGPDTIDAFLDDAQQRWRRLSWPGTLATFEQSDGFHQARIDYPRVS